MRVTAASTDGHERLDVSWTAPSTPVTGYEGQYQISGATEWTSHPLSGTGTSTTISSLQSNTLYEVQARAANGNVTSVWSASGSGRTAVRPLTVSYGASTYRATEGGAAATVSLSPAADRDLKIPIKATLESGDFRLDDLDNNKLSFARDSSSKTFQITATQDADGDDETVTLGFGTSLPPSVSAGTQASATVTLDDALSEPPQPPKPAVTAGTEEITVAWNRVSATPAVSSYALQYQSKASDENWPSRWTALSASLGASARSHLHTGLDWSKLYRYQVRASNRLDDGAWSDPSDEVAPKPPCPSEPGGFKVAAGNRQATLSWTDPGDASLTGTNTGSAPAAATPGPPTGRRSPPTAPPPRATR